MKTHLPLFFTCAIVALMSLCVQSVNAQDSSTPLSPQQLDQLTGPIALYPDPLLALVLAASTVPNDVSGAASYISGGGDPNAVESQGWDPSVQALAHYPQVIQWMAQNMSWTQELGAAYATQSTDVMDSVQRLRGQARAVGTLRNTPQDQVVVENGEIEIDPTDADQIYIPSYDPNVVYVSGSDPDDDFVYSEPYPTGVWLGFGFDWGHRRLWVGQWSDWHDGRHWHQPDFSRGGTAHAWRLPANHVRPDASTWNRGNKGNFAIARPNQMQASGSNSVRGGQRPANNQPAYAPRGQEAPPQANTGSIREQPRTEMARPSEPAPGAPSVNIYHASGAEHANQETPKGSEENRSRVAPAEVTHPAPQTESRPQDASHTSGIERANQASPKESPRAESHQEKAAPQEHEKGGDKDKDKEPNH